MGRESQTKKQHGLIDYVHMSIDQLHRLLLAAPWWMVCFGATLATIGMGALLLWFLVYSGMTEPVQFIYEGF
ncbi:hypothetical protein [Olsenella sp. Marseille-QA0557]|uniref:hypothetical protein n=1 Tax=Olsenella sp. Marseille-QA0557 TaxID=3378782 RepID=UPI003D0C7047